VTAAHAQGARHDCPDNDDPPCAHTHAALLTHTRPRNKSDRDYSEQTRTGTRQVKFAHKSKRWGVVIGEYADDLSTAPAASEIPPRRQLVTVCGTTVG